MVTINKGDIITAQNVRSGESAKGRYFLCRVKAEKGRDSITIWNNDGFECGEGDKIAVTDIISVSHKKKKYNEKWYEITDVVCSLMLAEGSGDAFTEMPGFDGDLPF